MSDQDRNQNIGFLMTRLICSRLHVRRTDKNREAAYHSLDEYMVHVAEWYDAYELTHPNVERKIYLATDEPAIIDQANSE